MDTRQEKQQVKSLSAQLTNAGVEILQALDDLHVKVAQARKLENDLNQALASVSVAPDTIRLPLQELEDHLYQAFHRSYKPNEERHHEYLAEQGIVIRNWHGEFVGTHQIVRE